MLNTHHLTIQDLLEDFPFFATQMTPDFRVNWANRMARECSGAWRRNIINKKCHEVWGHTLPCPDCTAARVVRTSRTWNGEISCRHPDDDPEVVRTWQVRLVPIMGEDNQLASVLEMAWDITRIRRIEQELEVNRVRLRDAQRLAHIGHWELIINTGDLFWSEEIFRIFEIDPDKFEASYEAFLEAIHPEDLEMVNQAYAHSVETANLYSIEHRLLMADGRIKFVQERCRTEYDQKGQAVKSIGTVQDITESKRVEAENKQLQERILQTRKLESVGRLAGGVAHDFNNMLCVILGHLDLIMDGRETGEDLSSALKEIHSAALRSSELTRQLLAFARRQPIAPQIVDLNQVIENMLRMLTRLIGEDIDLIWKPGRNLDRIKLDPSQVDQILANLCINARDAISGHGKIILETRNAFLGEDECRQQPDLRPGEFVILAVSDNGCGMDKTTVSRVFEPFFTTKDSDRGTGLGLATLYGIVKQNDGFVNVYSEPGNGTTFRIYFRVEQDTECFCIADAEPEPVVKGSETVLLVEDEIMILKFCTKMLRTLGYKVHAANSPEKALELARELGDEIDLLITDVIMPGMSGRDLAQSLYQDFPRLNTLYISGYTENVIAHHGILEQGIVFLQKPFSKAQLAQKVRKALTPRTQGPIPTGP